MKTTFKNSILLFVLTLFSLGVQAQDENMVGMMEVMKETKIQINNANRNFEKISTVQTITPHKPLNYDFNEIELNLPKLDTKAKVVTIGGENIPKLYNGYARIGYGTYVTPLVEAMIGSKRNENLMYGVHVKHYSSDLGPFQNARYGDTKVLLAGKYFDKDFTISSRMSYTFSENRFYGYNRAILGELFDEQVKQQFHFLDGQLNIENTNKKDKFDYLIGVRYQHMSDFFDTKEGDLQIKAAANYQLDDTKSIVFDGNLSIMEREIGYKQNRSHMILRPAFTYKGIENLSLTGGLNICFTDDTINEKDVAHFNLYPRIEATYLLTPKHQAFIVFDGEMQKNSLNQVIRENPWLEKPTLLLHTNRTIGIKGGLIGSIGKLNYKITVGNDWFKYQSFIINSITDSSKFNIVYDKDVTSRFLAEADFNTEVNERFRLGIQFGYYGYTLKNLEKPWHKPSIRASLMATYNIGNKIYIHADFYYIGGLNAKNYKSGYEVNLPNIADLSLKLEYRFSEVFSAFVEFNNLFGGTYQRYLNYPVKNMNFLGGLTYSF